MYLTRTEPGYIQDALRVPAESAPYIALIAEVLRVAIDDYVAMRTREFNARGKVLSRYEFNGAHAGHDAHEWLMSDGTGPFSFLWVCDVLRIDPDQVRNRIAATIARALTAEEDSP